MSDPQTAPAQTITVALAIAAEAVVSTIECEAARLPPDRNGIRWWDTRPMLDQHRHGPQFAAMHARDLHYALATGLAQRHPYDAHLVRLTGRT